MRVLASAWDQPRSGQEVARALAEGAQVVEDVHQAVRAATTSPEREPMVFCREVVECLCMPPALANPMSLRTLMGH